MLQSDISGTFSAEAARAHVIELLQKERFASRRALSLRLCQDFDFLDAKGDWQVSGCMEAPYALENKVAEIVLPAAASAPPKNAPRLLDRAVVPAHEVPNTEPELIFTDEELSFLGSYAARYKLPAPARLGDAVKLVAHYGGHREGKHRSDPGDQIMWTGYSRLSSATIGHQYGMEDGYRDGYQQGFKDGSEAE